MSAGWVNVFGENFSKTGIKIDVVLFLFSTDIYTCGNSRVWESGWENNNVSEMTVES
jgi:hypothetical protein